MLKKTEPSAPSISYILKKISDDKALILFNNIALAKDNSHIPLKEMNLSTKQYYSRISGLTSAGLIRKEQGQYCLTALGRIVYNAHSVIGKALSYYWKMKAIESIQSSAGRELAREDMLMLIQSLIDNHQVRDILLKSIPSVEALEMRQ
jgi:predicted transcriptional regulator